MDLDFSLIKVKSLDKSIDISSFHCREEELNSFLWESSEEYKQAFLGTTHVLIYDAKIIGYFTLSMDSLKIQRLPGIDRIGFENISR